MERFLRTTGVGTERLEMEPSTRRPLALLLPGVEVRCLASALGFPFSLVNM